MIRIVYLADYSESCSYKLLRGIVTYSKAHSAWSIYRMPESYRDNNGLRGVLAWAREHQADVLIGRFEKNDDVDMFRRNGILAIAQDHRVRFQTIPNITGNYRRTGQLAAQFFMRQGFTKFAFFGIRDTVWSQERRDGFFDTLRKAEVKTRLRLFETVPDTDYWAYDIESLREWLCSLPKGTALLACDDNFASRVIDTCRSLDISVPGTISVLGVDNDEMISGLTEPPLSSIDLDVEKAGYELGRMIDQYFASGKNPDMLHDIVIDGAQVVGRVSTDFFATDDVHIRAALTYIHQNIASNISVTDILAHVPLSRRLLEVRFKNVTNQTIHEYCLRRRMEMFARKLTSSDDSISHIAETMGIIDMKNLSRQFRNIYGASPREYRSLHREEGA